MHALLTNPWIVSSILVPALLIVLDVLSGLAGALKTHALSADFLPNFMKGQVLPAVGTLVGAYATGYFLSGGNWTAMALGAHATLLLFYVSQLDSISRNGAVLLGVPESGLFYALHLLFKSITHQDLPEAPTSDPNATQPAAPVLVPVLTPVPAPTPSGPNGAGV